MKDIQGQTTLAAALLKQWPAYLSYLTSFFTVGIVWANHHQTFKLIVRSNHGLRICNLFLLMTVTIIPFTTALLSEYILQPDEQRLAAGVFAAGWTLLSIAYTLLWRYAIHNKLVDPRLTPAMLQRATQRNLVGLLLYAVAIVVAYFSAILSVSIAGILAIYYLIV